MGKEKINLNQTVGKRAFGLTVKVVPLKELIKYKKKTCRKVDLDDIGELER